MDIFIQASQFILSLSLLIILHELGHFVPAKLFKTKVEKFYLFFNPYFSLFKKKIGETEYGVGWLPLGGYVKIAGMIDESMDKEQMAKPPQPWEFRSKPAWQRLIIMIGGVTVNVILAIIIYAGMMMYYGEQYLPNENAVYGVTTDSVARSIGLQNGDKIVSIGEKKIERFSEIPLELILSDANTMDIERDGKPVQLTITDEQKGVLIASKSRLVAPRIPYVVYGFVDSSAYERTNLELGDSLVGFNGKPMPFFDQYVEEVPKHAGEVVTLNIYRDGRRENIKATVSDTGTLGVRPLGYDHLLEFEFHKYGFFPAIPKGLAMAKEQLVNYGRQLKVITNTKTGAYKEVGGFYMIFKQFSPKWNWRSFWTFTAFLSIMLAFLNILPIPALDGGHVVFVLWEMISGRKPSQKVLEYSQIVGFIILLALIVLANGNDILGAIKGD